jgi:hypothetical protein
MSTRDYQKHTVSPKQPPAGNLGDEWYDPVNNYLYKLFFSEGKIPVWTRIPSSTTGISSGSVSSSAVNNYSTSLTIVDGTLTISLSYYSIFEINLSNNINSIAVSGAPAAGIMGSFMIIFTGDGTPRTVIWPNTFKWPNGVAPAITNTANKKDAFVFFTTNGGNEWEAVISGQNF